MQKLYISNKDETVKIFKNDFLEVFSRVHPSVPIIIFLPVISYFLYTSYYVKSLSISYIISLFSLGVVIWTLTEYLLHRFVFHYEFKGDLGQRIHFIFHGIHHAYPKDSRRLVMPPSVSIPLALLFYYIYEQIFGDLYVAPFFSGFITGYLFYDMTHFAIHHFNIKGGIFLELKKHHMKHHYMNPERGYGVSQPVWDIVYKTNFTDPDKNENTL